MNYIKQLQEQVKDLQAKLDCARAEVDAFRQHLTGGKFTGTEHTIRLCPRCNLTYEDGLRKDWIATADVHERLKHIRQWLD